MAVSIILLFLLSMVACRAPADAKKEETHLKYVEDQIEQFRQGVKYKGGVEGYLADGKPDYAALDRLAKALAVEPEPVREQISKVLVTIGRKTDPLSASGGNLIRNPMIVSVLIADGLRLQGAARDYCLEALHKSVPADMLRERGEYLARNLEEAPDEIALLVVAKAKHPDAVPVVDSLSRTAQWADVEEISIAKAALGDTEIEQKYVQRFLDAKNPEEKATLASTLGFIGTRPALSALAREMRTGLIFEMPGVFKRSVRVDIVAALSFAYPDKPFLYDNAIIDDEGYARIEKFCEEVFGIAWNTPRPPFLTIQGFPSGN